MKKRFAQIFSAAVLCGIRMTARADNYYYSGPTLGNWDGTPDGLFNWTDVTTGALAYVPPPGANAYILQSGTNGLSGVAVAYNYAYATNSGVVSLSIGSGNALSMSQPGASLIVNHGLVVGSIGSGSFSQSSGLTIVSAAQSAAGYGLIVGLGAGASGSMTLSGGTLQSGGGAPYFGGDGEIIGYTNGTGTFLQTGGLNTGIGPAASIAVGDNPGSHGTYTLQGGTVALAIYVGSGFGTAGIGDFEQTGGNVITSSLEVGVRNGAAGAGTFSLGGAGTITNGQLQGNDGQLIIGGTSGSGTFNQTGGLHTTYGVIYLGQGGSTTTGTYNLSGGTMVGGSLVMGLSGSPTSALGVFNQSGGTFTILGADSSHAQWGGIEIGSYSLSPGAAPDALYNMTGGTVSTPMLTVGYAADGVLEQNGGSILVTGTSSAATGLYVGQGGGSSTTSRVDLSGGLLQVAASEYLGIGATGIVNQNGGTHAIAANLYVAYAPAQPGGVPSVGTYNMSNGATLTVGGSEYIGSSGIGTFNQSGGGHTVSGTLYVQPGTATGNFNLSGGLLTAHATVNNGTFSQSGGSANIGPVSGTGTLSVGGGTSAATATVTSFAQSNVIVGDLGALHVTQAPVAVTNTAGSLTISGSGQLDLANHWLTTSSPAAQVRSYLVSAYNGGNWNNPGLNSSTVSTLNNNPANPNLKQYAIGYAAAGQLNVVPAVPAGQVLVRPTLFGDTNLDGKVDNADISAIVAAGHYMDGTTNNSWAVGDWNYDGKVDNNDMSMLVASGNYMSGKSYNGSTSSPARSGTSGSARLTSAGASTTSSGGSGGDGVPDYVYDASTGDVTFMKDGVTGLAQEVHVQSASGQLVPANLVDPNAGTGQDIANSYEIDLFRQGTDPRTGQTRQFPDGYDLGAVLPTGLTLSELTSDLTLTYTVDGGGMANIAADVIVEGTTGGMMFSGAATSGVPEPSLPAVLGLIGAGLASRRRRPARTEPSTTRGAVNV